MVAGVSGVCVGGGTGMSCWVVLILACADQPPSQTLVASESFMMWMLYVG